MADPMQTFFQASDSVFSQNLQGQNALINNRERLNNALQRQKEFAAEQQARDQVMALQRLKILDKQSNDLVQAKQIRGNTQAQANLIKAINDNNQILGLPTIAAWTDPIETKLPQLLADAQAKMMSGATWEDLRPMFYSIADDETWNKLYLKMYSTTKLASDMQEQPQDMNQPEGVKDSKQGATEGGPQIKPQVTSVFDEPIERPGNFDQFMQHFEKTYHVPRGGNWEESVKQIRLSGLMPEAKAKLASKNQYLVEIGANTPEFWEQDRRLENAKLLDQFMPDIRASVSQMSKATPKQRAQAITKMLSTIGIQFADSNDMEDYVKLLDPFTWNEKDASDRGWKGLSIRELDQKAKEAQNKAENTIRQFSANTARIRATNDANKKKQAASEPRFVAQISTMGREIINLESLARGYKDLLKKGLNDEGKKLSDNEKALYQTKVDGLVRKSEDMKKLFRSTFGYGINEAQAQAGASSGKLDGLAQKHGLKQAVAKARQAGATDEQIYNELAAKGYR
jgi:hypothetical protein